MVSREMLKRARSEMSHIFGRKGFFSKDCEEQYLWEERETIKRMKRARSLGGKGIYCLSTG